MGSADLELHQALGGKADHLAQEIGVGGLFEERAEVHPSYFSFAPWLSILAISYGLRRCRSR
jgi:hypothetical protein